jgi:putative CRISPR-associated protein (TIGR02620 family)
MEVVIVTRHAALVQVLAEDHGITGRVVPHATEADIVGKVVVGILPFSLAAKAAKVGTLVLDLPADLRGKELTAAEVRQYATNLEWFVVRTESQQQWLLDDSNHAGLQGSLGRLAQDMAPASV